MSYSVKDLSKLTGFSPYAIRHYVAKRLIPKAAPAGPYTRYTEDHLVRLLAIRKLTDQGMNPTGAAIHLGKSSAAEVREIAGLPPLEPPAPPPPPADAQASAAPAPSSPGADAPPRTPYRAAFARPRETWEHIPICPGLELRVRSDADNEARRVAAEIEAAWSPRD